MLSFPLLASFARTLKLEISFSSNGEIYKSKLEKKEKFLKFFSTLIFLRVLYSNSFLCNYSLFGFFFFFLIEQFNLVRLGNRETVLNNVESNIEIVSSYMLRQLKMIYIGKRKKRNRKFVRM